MFFLVSVFPTAEKEDWNEAEVDSYLNICFTKLIISFVLWSAFPTAEKEQEAEDEDEDDKKDEDEGIEDDAADDAHDSSVSSPMDAVSAQHTVLTKEEQVQEEISPVMQDVLMRNRHLHLPGFEQVEA